MKKLATVFCALCAMLIVSACATTPNFKSLKEVECYAEQERLSKTNRTIVIGSTFDKVENRKKKDIISTGLGGGIVAPLMLLPGRGKQWQITGTVWLPTRLIVYRNEPGKTPRDVGPEALKRAGEPPASASCIYDGSRVRTNPLLLTEYQGEDGHIKIAKSIFIDVYFRDNESSEVPCDKKTWGTYIDYARKVANSVKDVMQEEFNRVGPYCPAGGGI
jgi:hypothetical protein